MHQLVGAAHAALMEEGMSSCEMGCVHATRLVYRRPKRHAGIHVPDSCTLLLSEDIRKEKISPGIDALLLHAANTKTATTTSSRSARELCEYTCSPLAIPGMTDSHRALGSVTIVATPTMIWKRLCVVPFVAWTRPKRYKRTVDKILKHRVPLPPQHRIL
jgi:hypothetical protein